MVSKIEQGPVQILTEDSCYPCTLVVRGDVLFIGLRKGSIVGRILGDISQKEILKGPLTQSSLNRIC